MSSIGTCSLCKSKCITVWVTNPCKHGACSKCLVSRRSFTNCLESRRSFTNCFTCQKEFEFLVCPGFQFGCQFQADQGTWEQHEGTCMFRPVECPQCDAIVSRKTLSQHINKECSLRFATCRHCRDNVFQVELDHHERSCPEAPISCSFCHQGNIKRGRLPDHAKACQKTPKPCPLNEYGCGFVELEGAMDEHLNFKSHVSCFQKLKKILEERVSEVASLRNQLDTLKNEMRESVADSVTLFDKGFSWTAFVPASYWTANDEEPYPLTSPVYRHRSMKTIFCFKMRFQQYLNEWKATLSPHTLLLEDSFRNERFTVQIAERMSGSVIGTRENYGIEQVLQWKIGRSDSFYVVTVTRTGALPQ